MQDLDTLISRWSDGDEAAAERIYARFRERVFRLAYGLLGDSAEAEEVAQDSLLYALRQIGRYDARRAKFTTWLHTITVSRCRDRQRKRRLKLISISALIRDRKERPAREAGPEDQVVRAESRNKVWQSVQTLRPSLREAIVLRHWGGHTYREIADILGCPLGTAQSRVRLAYRQLEKGLTDIRSSVLINETR